MNIIKYSLVGGAAAIVDIGLYTLFAVVMNFNYLAVGACSFLIATALNYRLGIMHVFESGSRFSGNKEIYAVFIVSGVGLLINQGILITCVEYFEISKLLAKILACGLVFFWNYSIRSYYIFSPERSSAANS